MTPPATDIITHLRQRALVQDITDPALVELCRTKSIAVYAGFGRADAQRRLGRTACREARQTHDAENDGTHVEPRG